MNSKKKAVKKKTVKRKQGGVSKTKPKTKTKITHIKYETRVLPVHKTYKIFRHLDPQDSSIRGEIRAYEDGIQICIFNVEHQRAWDAAMFHLQALAYKEEK